MTDMPYEPIDELRKRKTAFSNFLTLAGNKNRLVGPSEFRVALAVAFDNTGTMFFGPEPQSSNQDGFVLNGQMVYYLFKIEDVGSIVQNPWWYRAAAGIEMMVFEVMQE